MSTYSDYIELKATVNFLKKPENKIAPEVIRFYDALRKKAERESRCIIDGKRCMKKCSKCERTRTGNALSLDALEETMEHLSDCQPLEEGLEEQELHKALHKAIDELSDTDRSILIFFSLGFSEREIGEMTGMSQKSVNNHKQRLLSLLREELKEYV